MGKKLVLAGGGHAHMMLLAHISTMIADGHQVTVVQPADYHYYSGMGPGMLSTHYVADDIRFNTRFVVERQGGTFVQAKVIKVETNQQTILTDTEETIPYDVLSCNVGSFVPFTEIEGNRDNIFSAKPIEKLQEAQQKIISLGHKNWISIAVIGGGPAAIEIAGNANHLAHTTGCKNITTRLFAGQKVMKDFSNPIRKIIRKTFKENGIEIDESRYVDKIINGTIVLKNGSSYSPDIIFLATGVKPSPLFANSDIATGPDGGLLVNQYLQCTDFDNIFGGGDCIHFSPQPLAKVGVYAVRQNPVLLNNVLAALNGNKMEVFDPGGNYLLIFNLGKGFGALQKGFLIWSGKSAFFIKDYIDKKFMQKFHALEGKEERR